MDHGDHEPAKCSMVLPSLKSYYLFYPSNPSTCSSPGTPKTSASSSVGGTSVAPGPSSSPSSPSSPSACPTNFSVTSPENTTNQPLEPSVLELLTQTTGLEVQPMSQSKPPPGKGKL